MATQQQKTQVLELYTAYFNRAADTPGMNYWLNEMVTNDWSIDDVAVTFSQQIEYTNLYGALSNAQIVSQVYTNVLNREAEVAGAQYWEGELSNGNISVTQLVQAVVNAVTVEDAEATDKALFNNKIEVSQYYYENNSNATNVSLTTITQENASVESLKSAIEVNPAPIDTSIVSIGVEYETFNLEGFSQYGIDGKHLYILATSSDGTQYVLEGGLYAEDPVNITTRTAELYRGDVTSTPEGYIGKPSSTNSTYVALDTESRNTSEIWNDMLKHAQSIEDAQIEYIFSPGPNSNSVAASIINDSGFDVEQIMNITLPDDINSQNAMSYVMSGATDMFSVGFIGVTNTIDYVVSIG